MAVEVALLGAITIAASGYFLLAAFGSIVWWGWLLLAVTLFAGYAALWTWYKHLLVDNQ
jgi:hypothetical protein